MLIYNIKTQVEFDLGYNLLIFDGVMGLLLKHSTKIGVHSISGGILVLTINAIMLCVFTLTGPIQLEHIIILCS